MDHYLRCPCLDDCHPHELCLLWSLVFGIFTFTAKVRQCSQCRGLGLDAPPTAVFPGRACRACAGTGKSWNLGMSWWGGALLPWNLQTEQMSSIVVSFFGMVALVLSIVLVVFFKWLEVGVHRHTRVLTHGHISIESIRLFVCKKHTADFCRRQFLLRDIPVCQGKRLKFMKNWRSMCLQAVHMGKSFPFQGGNLGVVGLGAFRERLTFCVWFQRVLRSITRQMILTTE